MKTLLLLVLSCYCSFTYGQSPSNQSSDKAAQKNYEQAGKYMGLNDFQKAIVELQQAVSRDKNFSAAYQQMGDIYRRLQNYNAAKESYKRVLKINPDFHPLTYFGLGESEFNTGEYAEALQHFKKYAASANLSEKSKELVSRYILNSEFSMKAVEHPVPFNPVNMGAGINTKEQEYLPVLTADEETLIFTRQVNGNEDFFKSSKQNGNWDKSVYLSKNINTDYNEGAQYISPDGMYLFFTGCNRPDGLGRCDIYVSRREGKDWSTPFNIGAPINTAGWESQPSLSADGRTLYFTSTRPGGRGGYDIWKSDLKTDGSWTNPVNLGPNINTPYDEQSPFIHPDGQTLYFSSNGWPGFGNKDIFISRKDSSVNLPEGLNWSKPENLGYPINTFGEESSLTIAGNGKTAFFASDKPGGFGGLDLYSFELPVNLRPKPVTYVKGKIFDKKTSEPLTARIRIINLKNGKVIYDDSNDDDSGDFLVSLAAGQNLALNVDKEGYLFYSENFSLDKPNSADKPFILSVPLQKLEVGGIVALRNIFFETNKYDLLPESKTELQELISFLTLNPKISMEIQGHTDNVGDETINQKLSENRAKSVYNYLIDNKINSSRLTVKGYGESNPIEDNSTEEGRQKNRRTEFRITKNQDFK
jgi:outer membrane protein OmpA-like peptidoglycan-associated protein/tetratricopeptide (TPR) repeat protein